MSRSDRTIELRNALERSITENELEQEWTPAEKLIWVMDQLENYCRRWLQMTKGLPRDERFGEQNDLWCMVQAGFDVASELLRGARPLEQKLECFRNEIQGSDDTMTPERIEQLVGEISESIRALQEDGHGS